jgi:tetratricopeptide (TPR) repeat protein
LSGNWEGLPGRQPGGRAGLALTRIPGAATVADWTNARWISAPAVLAAAVSFLIVVPLAASDGGYWPTAWSWATLVFAWVAVVTLVFRDELRVSMLERLFLLAIGCFAAWIALSLLWTSSTTRTVLELERALAYLAMLFAVVVLVRRGAYRSLLGGAWAGIVVVCTYALATRLFPERLGVFDPVAGYRLSEPLGYWNALGIFACLGAVLALGFAARADSVAVRCVAAASLLVLLPTVYFTFSRASWVALGVGFVCAALLDPRRLQLIAAAIALAVAPAAGVAVAFQSDALTRLGVSVEDASREGHRLAGILFALAVANALIALGFAYAERHLPIPSRVRQGYAVVLAVVVALALVAAFARFGSPPTIVKRVHDAILRPAPVTPDDLNRRLFNLSSRGRVTGWQVAWRDAREHPVLGSGAGTFELYWLEHRPSQMKIRDAHSLYLETLAELGPPGLAILSLALALPLAGAIRARRRALVPAAVGAYVAFLLHAGVDWDWEMVAVTIAALLCGTAALARSRSNGEVPISRRWRFALLGVPFVLTAIGFVGVNGNGALADAREDANQRQWVASEADASKAQGWLPWSSDPWQFVGDAHLARGDRRSAEQSFRTAIDKDPNDSELWQGLAYATRGRERRAALEEALRLNPRNPDLLDLAKRLGIEATPPKGSS